MTTLIIKKQKNRKEILRFYGYKRLVKSGGLELKIKKINKIMD